MSRDFIFKRTYQLSEHDKSQILDLFFKVFGKSLSQEHFNRKYLCTPFGYSYHGLMVVNGLIVGVYNVIPYRYSYFGKETIFGLSVDSMVVKEYRSGPFNVSRMATIVYEAMQQDSIGFVFGFPNDIAYEYTKRVLKWKDISELDFYILPRNIGAVIPKLRPVNCLFHIFAAGLVRLPWFWSLAETRYNIQKVSDTSFEAHRYDGRYDIVELGEGGKCVYRICIEEHGIRTLHIIDVCPLRSDFFEEAVRKLYRQNAKLIDVILYVGRLPFVPRQLIRVSESKRPRRIRMCGKLLAPSTVDDRVFQIKNWNVNISNFDVR